MSSQKENASLKLDRKPLNAERTIRLIQTCKNFLFFMIFYCKLLLLFGITTGLTTELLP